jgi:hypothetical protein
LDGFTGKACDQQVESESEARGTNSGSDPMWIYVAAGVGSLTTISLLIAVIFFCKRRQTRHQINSPAETGRVLEMKNPVYDDGDEWSPGTGSCQTNDQLQVGRERVPSLLRPLPLPPVGGDFQAHNPMFGRENPGFLPDTLQRPDLFTPYDMAPATQGFPTSVQANPFEFTSEDIYDYVE